MKLAFIFPGQGAQFEGMGKDIYTNYEKARQIYDKVEEITKIDVAKLSFYTDIEILSQTKNTQIAIFTMSMAILEILKEKNIQADISTGLSLGEYTALAYSEMIKLEDAIKIVKTRGELMQDLVPNGEWAMVAVLGMTDEDVEKMCKTIQNGFVVPANYNCPGQVVVSGDEIGIQNLMEKAKEFGAKKVVRLKTSGPFHTIKLENAANQLEKELKKIEFTITDKKVIKNIDGTEYIENDDIVEILSKHVMSPVKFSKSIENMINQGVDTFVEIGPRKSIVRFCKKDK